MKKELTVLLILLMMIAATSLGAHLVWKNAQTAAEPSVLWLAFAGATQIVMSVFLLRRLLWSRYRERT